MSLKMKLFDAVGEEILPGCSVVYPVYTSGEISMRRMDVTSAHDGRVVGYRRDNGRRVTIKNVHNCIVVHARDVEDDGFYDWSR